ncbi:MAG: M20/M25/M40 family metallo-hydrolase [Candidatus Zipacnadales bacterium]
MIDFERLRAEFLELLQIDSPTRSESAVAAWLKAKLEELGVAAEDDGTATTLGGNSGNLIAYVAGNASPPLLLNAHMDNVPPCRGVTPIVEGDIIRTNGTTVLGGDDKCGCLTIVTALREVLEGGLPHPPLEVVFTAAEETGLEGAKALDYSRITARHGFVLESGTVGTITVKAPSAQHWDATLIGKAAHAGVAPEKGISAIRMAAEAIAEMRLGRLDEETTTNVGLIEGGEARNIVPPHCTLHGEARSHDQEKLAAQIEHVRECLSKAAKRYGGILEFEACESYRSFDIRPGEWPLRIAEQAARDVGLIPLSQPTGGGSDANVFNEHGICCVILRTGAAEVHTTEEYVDLNDLLSACRWLTRIIELAGS